MEKLSTITIDDRYSNIKSIRNVFGMFWRGKGTYFKAQFTKGSLCLKRCWHIPRPPFSIILKPCLRLIIYIGYNTVWSELCEFTARWACPSGFHTGLSCSLNRAAAGGQLVTSSAGILVRVLHPTAPRTFVPIPAPSPHI